MSNGSDETHWLQDTQVIIQDIKTHVHDISVANLPCSNSRIFFNLTTLEMKNYCVELSSEGFQIVGEKYDSEEKRGKYKVYETPYSMLDTLSPAYRDSFGKQLIIKLHQMQENQENNDDQES